MFWYHSLRSQAIPVTVYQKITYVNGYIIVFGSVFMSIEKPNMEPKQKNNSFTDELSKSGALDMIAEAIISIYTNPKQKTEAYTYFLNSLGVTEQYDVEKLLQENQDRRKRINELKIQIKELEGRINKQDHNG